MKGGKWLLSLLFISVVLVVSGVCDARTLDPDVLCEQAKEAQDNGDLVKSLCLLCQAMGASPESGEIKSKALSVELQVKHLVSKGKECKDVYLMKKLEEAEEELVSLKKKMVTEKAEWYKFYRDKVEKLQAAYEDKIKALEDKYKLELQQQSSKTEELVEQIKEGIEKEKEELRTKLENQVKILQQALDQKNKELEERDKKIAYLSSAYARLKDELIQKYEKKYTSQIEKLQSQLDILKKSVAEKEELIKDLNSRVKDLKEKANDYLSQLSELRAKNGQLKSTIEEVRHKSKMELLSKEKEYQSCLGEVTDLRNKMKVLQKELDALRLRNRSLEQRVEIQEKKATQQKQELDRLSQKLKQKEVIIRNQKVEIEQLKDTLFTCRTQLQSNSWKGDVSQIRDGGSRKQKASRRSKKSNRRSEKHKKDTSKQNKNQRGTGAFNTSSSGSSDSDFDRAVAAIDDGNYKVAKALLEKVLKDDPDNEVAKNLLDSVKLLLGED